MKLTLNIFYIGFFLNTKQAKTEKQKNQTLLELCNSLPDAL